MTEKLNEALTTVETTYAELVEIANDMVSGIVGSANEVVNEINSRVNAMSIEQIRDYILVLQLKAFEISEIKEKSIMKAEISENIRKEVFAIKFNSNEGSAAVKEKLATVDTSAETITTVLYSLVSNLLKTKLDQLHRLVDALKSILMSRMQETKFMNIGTTEYVPPTTNGRITLNE